MIKEIKALEAVSRKLDPDTDERLALADAAISYSEDFLKNLPHAPAFQMADASRSGLYYRPISEDGIGIHEVLTLLKENVDSQGINTPSARHLAYIPGGPLYHSALGDFLADITNRFSGHFYGGPGAVRIENILLQWLASFVGYPSTATGNLTSGGSLANLIAILTARDSMELKSVDFSRAVIYMTGQAHHSIEKALRIAGLGESTVHLVPMDEHFRMLPQALDHAIQEDQNQGRLPWLIVGNAGSTDTGAVDPLEAIHRVAEERHLWLHVDGAYGAFFALTHEGQKILKGMEYSDSLTLDPHKGLFLPYGSGAVLVRDGQKLYQTLTADAHYLQDVIPSREEMAPKDLSAELTRPFRGLRLWLPLQLLGTRPFQAALEEKLLLARYFYQEVQKIPGVEVGPPPDLSIVIFRIRPKSGDENTHNQKLIQDIQQDGRIFLSSTTLDGKFWIRMAILNFRTHLDTIELALEVIREMSDRLSS